MSLVPKNEDQATNNKKKEKKQKGERTKSKAVKPTGKAPLDFKALLISLRDKLPKQINPSKSVGIRLFLIFFIAIMFFVLTIGIMSSQMAKGTIQDNAEQANLQTIVQTSQKLDIVMQKYEENLQQMFLDDEMQNAIMDASLSNITDYDKFTATNKMRTRLNTLTFSMKGISAIYMLSVDKIIDDVTSGSANAMLMEKVRGEAWFKELSESTKTVWLQVPSEGLGSPVFRLARSVQSVNSMKRFVLIADVNLDVLNGYLKEVNLGNNSKLQMLTQDNIVVGSSAEGDDGKASEFDMKQAGDKTSGTFHTKDANGNSVLASFNTQASGWKLVGTVDTAELTKSANSILMVTIFSLIVVAIIAILIGVWMVRMIAHPLGKLRNLMEEGSRGNLNVRMNTKAKDEIGQLTVSFNVMMENITALVKQTNNSAQDVLDTATELSQASNKTALSAKEIAVATEEIANGATSLANEAERGNELTENISRQMERVIQTNKEMESSARQVEKSSQQGTEYLSGLMEKTNMTVEMINALTAKVDSLKASTSSVLKVLDVMQNITQQTNILSLNATIEAARAGAAGRGFMVVADEIRQLADQSRQSITMVGEITDTIQKEMNETVKALSEASPIFQEQIASVQETSQIFVSVQQQMEGFVRHLDSVTASIDQLNESQSVLSEAMSNVSAVAQQSSATSEEVASLSSEQQTVGDQLVQLSNKLENVSTGLKESLSKFTV
ncbi:methyl-accepting chemotaxis protein [Paenibacillus timonensis]|uniref:Methyl-accepting chemotaxis protein n=1 Tax=Paenibacillus timonensis TaxID=225915 RepID=A0ABW3SCS1_9BACL|nr:MULTISPECIES: methyl-accepting chemotaxis protein [Paenibacillus]MCH1640379.1 methyl-accepting chemotaxis protein [Paenibacillus timonensis]MDU2241443.1 methyl-accepting chemotaxis protein [Paenibacillus sp.]